MRAHTIATKARVGARAGTKRAIVPRGILALSLAVVLLGATASTASTTPTPPAPPLTLSWGIKDRLLPDYRSLGPPCCSLLKKKLKLRVTSSNNSTLAVGGDLKRTTKDLAAGEPTKFTARLEQSKWKQLKEEVTAPKPVRLKAKIKFKATDEFGQTVTDEFKLKFVYR